MLSWALVGVAAAAAAWWWLVALVPTVTVIAAARGTAVEIVYATGVVERVRWARVASIIRDRIVKICDCRRQNRKTSEGTTALRNLNPTYVGLGPKS